MSKDNASIEVQLIGTQPTGLPVTHARGHIALSKMVDTPLLTRKGHIYMFSSKLSRPNLAVYEETQQPYLITEF